MKLLHGALWLGLLSIGLSPSADAVAAAPARPVLSPAARARFAEVMRSPEIDSVWRAGRDHAISHVIDPDEHECAPTDFDAWVGGQLGSIDFASFLELVSFGALDWPLLHTLLFDQNASDEFIGADGRDTQEMVRRFRTLQSFWDVPTGDVLLQGMHGAVIADDAKMVPVVQFLFGVGAAEAQGIVDHVQSIIDTDPTIDYGFPFFSLNALAYSERTEPPGSPFVGLPDKLAMGDGLLAALRGIGLGTNGPDTVISHEFGHHVQFELGVLDDFEPTPEATRRAELMADAFGAYFCAHSRGAGFQAKRIADTFGAAFAFGDCVFDLPGHHGTPNQRRAAAIWGAGVAEAAQKQGSILSSATMLALFDAQLPAIVAPDK